mmetsp:Transcript_27317/g.41118  ORF Transcript_27317/g.41118 Transcript_27317/m.41118 type:complete len:817 (+) Transcript_27317:132-2582(+)|eukprot:CAMPEP_0203682838 /NCGR_PEP_ID=MMETSP0090-20130426/47207_1 /ASSEMBLY_ACC=CAM_ASM_001088 /TAXON_ID=426623 /ORGANISM="Chaetoceros affinis, Strain CCMP159" /LENGTH=816 /DNA_ID=CAMNT_0050551955 /DNA_START=57 /DNA_END=2507 /DNA_ORIENTATION=-
MMEQQLTQQMSAAVSSATAPSNKEAERLSSDLALFLSNPTLSSGLADGSLDLKSYSSTIQAELNDLEMDCIEIYKQNSNTIASLREDMTECDTILASLQEMLLGFQADLGGLSGDIRSLQQESQTLGIQLTNRREAEMNLRQYLSRIIVPPSLADVICRGPVDSVFLKGVQELETKYQYLNSTSGDENHNDLSYPAVKDPSKTPSGEEMKEHVTKLRYRAIMRSRTYFLQTISQLRKPKTNVRMIQINSLLKYTPLIDFLLEAQPDVYCEVRDVYTDSMSRTLFALFRTYAAQLSLLDNAISTRKDVIAVEDSALRDVWTRVNMNKRGDAFCLGDRGNILELDSDAAGSGEDRSSGPSPSGATLTPMRRDQMQRSKSSSQTPGASMASAVNDISMPILAHVALAEGKKYPYEVIFKSVMMHLMDSVTNEYVFVRQFFKENGAKAFDGIFQRTFNLLLEQLENYLFNCFDCLGLLLMIKLTHANKRIMKERKVDSLDKFFESVTNLLWSRLKTVMDKQLRSVRDGLPAKLGTIDLHAHYVSRRYAEFTCSILQILYRGNKGLNARAASSGSIVSASDDGNKSVSSRRPSMSSLSDTGSRFSRASISHRGSAGDMLLNDLSTLQDETVLLLQRLAEAHTSNKKKIIFLINNIDQIISIFQERRVPGKEMNHFLDLLMQQRELFVEEELLQNFSKMIAFVQQTEQHMSRSQFGASASKAVAEGNKVEVNPQVVESLVLEFASTWKQGIEQINRNVLSFFANFRNGMEILKQVLTQLLLYYTRFQDIIRKVWRSKPPAFCKDLVSTSSILIEIKKYALAI